MILSLRVKNFFLAILSGFPFITLFANFIFATDSIASESAITSPVPPPVLFGTGKLTFFFQDISIRTLLQLIAKNSGLNFIISDAVKGNTTLNLKDVTWKQALDVIMQSHGLTARQVGNVMYISTIEDITSTESKELQSEQQLSNLAPIESSIIQLRYANAKDLEDFIKGQAGTLLTPRGQVAADIRTNSLIIRDTQTNLSDLKRTIKRLDVPAKQVLIEARIVTIDTNYEEQLGIKFGASNQINVTGSLTGANTLATGTPLAAVPLNQRLNFSNPATQLESGATPASVGMALARLGAVFVDMELSAIEEEGHGQIIASPHVITSNLQKASIETGEEIPYQESTSSGATSIEFKKAVLSLEITPQITSNNKIVLHMKATEDSRGQQLQISAGQTAGAPPVLGPPIINSQGVESNVLLNNNETIVIGGIYKQTKLNTVDRIPFLGSIPVVGSLFRSNTISNDRSELLIFVTPKIINPFAANLTKEPNKLNEKTYKTEA